MAEAALFSIAQMVLKQLGSKVLQEAALLWGIGDDIKKLTRTLSSLQAVLLDAEEQSHSPQSHQLRLWLKELRQVVYDAEDLVDDFFIEVRRHQGISDSGSITSIPSFSPELQRLTLRGGSKELLQQILRMPPSSSSTLPPRSSCLVNLKISKVLDLDTLPEEILSGLSSSFFPLEKLTIKKCPQLRTLSIVKKKLRTLSPALPHHLASLQRLEIRNCEKLDLCDGDDGEMMMQQQEVYGGVLLPRLSEVDFTGIPKLNRLPEWLQVAAEMSGIRAINCPIFTSETQGNCGNTATPTSPGGEVSQPFKL